MKFWIFTYFCKLCVVIAQNLLPGGEDDDVEDEDEDDGFYTDEADLRRKLSRLSGPGGALESQSRMAPELMAPGGIAATLASRPDGEDLVREARAGAVDLSTAFSDIDMVKGRKKLSDVGKPGVEDDNDHENEDDNDGEGVSEKWGSFDDEDWREGKMSGEVNTGEGGRGEIGHDVPGLLGGERFDSPVGKEWGGVDTERSGVEEGESHRHQQPPRTSR